MQHVRSEAGTAEPCGAVCASSREERLFTGEVGEETAVLTDVDEGVGTPRNVLLLARSRLAGHGAQGTARVLRTLSHLRQVREERHLTVDELAKKSGVPRRTIAGLEAGARRAQQQTAERLARALDVEPDELRDTEGVTLLEEKRGSRVRVVRRYDEHTLELSYDESRLGDAYRIILESWDGWGEFRDLMPAMENRYGRAWVVECLSRIVRSRLTGERFVLPEVPSDGPREPVD